MSAETKQDSHLQIGHVLFLDLVAYSKLLVDEQRELQEQLNEIVHQTKVFRTAEAENKVVRLPTGDGMALVFFTNAEAPVRCALEIAEASQGSPALRLRMGINSGPVSGVADMNGRSNIAGGGINTAQRVMDLGDAGHILLSKRAAEDLIQYREWQPHLHELGEVEVKHGVKVSVVSLYTDKLGNPELPTKLELAARKECTRRARKRFAVVGALVFALVAVVALSIFLRYAPRQTGPLMPEKSVAVLPFENLSKDEENAFFAGGVQDEILSNLAKIADLKVISRTSVMKYKGGPERNLPEIAKTLGVSHVVEGSVQRAGGRIRVSAQLIDARNDAHLWAEHYDRDTADVFAIQTDIAERIADQLRAKLSVAEKAAIEERPTADPVAYAYYIQAKAIGEVDDWEDWEKSVNRQVDLLEKATQRDPNFALAYCALARAHCDLFSLTGPELDSSRTHLDLAKKAAEAALRVRPDFGEAHLELARYYFFADNFDRARDELVVARRNLPNNSEALYIAGRIDRRQNRWDSAVTNLQKANDLDPRNGELAFFLGETYLFMRCYSECERLIKSCAASGTFKSPWIETRLSEIKLAQGDPVAAQSLLDQVPLDFSPIGVVWELRFNAALYLRNYDAANRVIAAMPAKFADTFPFRWITSPHGRVARARGDNQTAQSIFLDARKRLDATWGNKVKDATYYGLAAELDAGLGRKEEVIRASTRSLPQPKLPADSGALSGFWAGCPSAQLLKFMRGSTS